VFRLLKFALFMVLLGAGIYYGMTVKLGERTFFQHVRAIWETKETQELRRGTKQKVGGLVEEATDQVVKGVAKNSLARGCCAGRATKSTQAKSHRNPRRKNCHPRIARLCATSLGRVARSRVSD